MSRVGKEPVPVPDKVEVKVGPDNVVKVKGPLGELEQAVMPQITVEVNEGEIVLTRSSGVKAVRALHGLSRALIANMVTGVTVGFERRLGIQGVGYRADMDGESIRLRVGYSHDVVIPPLPGIELSVDGNQTLVVRGMDKQAVGQMAADLRSVRPVEPYKGKGIRCEGERVRRKAGKAAKVGIG